MQLRSSRSTSSRSRCAYQSSVAPSYNTSLYDSNYAVLNSFLHASITDDINILTALYSNNREIEPIEILEILSIYWRACEINSYKIMFPAAPSSMTKLLEFREG